MNKYPTVNYIGNKTKIASWIVDHIPNGCSSVVDLFSGGSSVSFELKKNGYQVYSNDVLYANYVLAKALIENDDVVLSKDDFESIFISETDIKDKYNEISFLTNLIYYDYEVKELSKLLLISKKMNGYKRYLFLSLLRRAMIRKIPYSRMNVKWEEIKKLRDEEYSYKKYGRYRAYHNKSFLYHIESYLDEYNAAVFKGNKKNKVFQMDGLEFARMLSEKVDLVYIDPPYPSTMNNYESFYGYFDVINEKKINNYINLTRKDTFLNNLSLIIDELRHKTKYIMISLNNKSKPSCEEICQMIENYSSNIQIFKKEHTYKVTGKENKNTNFEILILAKM